MAISGKSAATNRGRCPWAERSPARRIYQDQEGGVPTHDDGHLFEMLTLEGARAGLSWATILNRRDGYRHAFEGFDPVKVAAFTDRRLEKLLQDTGIIRNRLKIYGTRTNARGVVRVQREFSSFDAYLWYWVGGARFVIRTRSLAVVPAHNEQRDRTSNAINCRGVTYYVSHYTSSL